MDMISITREKHPHTSVFLVSAPMTRDIPDVNAVLGEINRQLKDAAAHKTVHFIDIGIFPQNQYHDRVHLSVRSGGVGKMVHKIVMVNRFVI
jgi:hypothetical protein